MAGFAANGSVAGERVKARHILPRDALRPSVSIPLVFLCGLAFGTFFVLSLNRTAQIVLNVAVLAVVVAWVASVFARRSVEAGPQLLAGAFLLALGSTLGFASGLDLAVEECLIKTAGVVLVVFAIDRKQRARAVADVRSSERFLESILDSIAEPLVVLGEGCRILALNRCAGDTFGANLQDARPCDTYLPPRGCETCHVQEVWQKRKPRFEVLRDPDRRQRAEVNTFPINTAVGFSGTLVQRLHDVSRRSPDDATRDPISDVVNSMRDAVISLGLDRRVRSINRAALTMFGLDAEAVLGKPVADVLRFADPDGRAVFEEAVKIDQNWEGELLLRSAAGESLPCLISLAPVYSGEDRLLGPALLIKNLSQLKELNLQLMQAEKLSAIGQLISGVAHELNNPLTAVCGFTELMLEEVTDPHMQHCLSAVERHAERCRRIVENLLRFSRRHPPEKVRASLNAVIDGALELVAHQLTLDGIEIERRYDAELPDTWVDPFQIQQVLVNVFNNAQQALKTERRRKRLILQTRRLGPERLRVHITDTGPGMTEEVRQRIFDPFFTTKAVGRGTGLGLSVSYGIMRDHGGSLGVESELGQGSTFILELPITSGPPVHVKEPDEVPAIDEPLDVLVIDDEPVILEILTSLLEGDGHRVIAAADGREATELLGARSFDVVLSDVRMPEMGGPELCGWIQEHRPDCVGRVALLSGDVMSQDLLDFVSESRVPLLGKPFKLDEIRRCLAQLTQKGRVDAADRVSTSPPGE